MGGLKSWKIYILARSASASSAGGRVSRFPVWALRMLLFHMGVQSGITKICFVAELALEVPPIDVVLGATLAFPLVCAASREAVFLRLLKVSWQAISSLRQALC